MSAPWLADAATTPGPWPASAGWQLSNNSGGSYVAYTGQSVNEVAGPVGTQRYRNQFTIPAGATGTWNFTAQGDIWDGSQPASQWQIRYDGVLVGSFSQYSFGTVTLPATPGAHTLEIWVAAADGNTPRTQLFFASAQYPAAAAAVPVPCCCPPNAALTCYTPALLGPELLTNGDFAASTGIGAASSVGPGWTQDPGAPPGGYSPCGPNIYAAPCSAGSWSYFTTNMGQVAGGAPATIFARGGRSMAVNVSSSLSQSFIRWDTTPLVNGQQYRFQCQAAIDNPPFAVALNIDGTDIGALTQPPVVGQWALTQIDFVWTGTTGNHSVRVRSNSTVFGGNDHAFDEFSLRSRTPGRRAFPLVCGDTIAWYDAEDGHELTPAELAGLTACSTDD